LLAAGATLVKEEDLADGSYLVMMRDPWGLAIQLCRRGTPMLAFDEKGRCVKLVFSRQPLFLLIKTTLPGDRKRPEHIFRPF